MPGQGAIIATGAIDYPAEFAGTSEETRAMLGSQKVLMVTCTYDHRIIQGAESGAFLAKLQQLLRARTDFYDSIFRDLKIPYHAGPVADGSADHARAAYAQVNADVAKEAAVIQLINAYRIRGHLLANTNPLGQRSGLSSRTRSGLLRPFHLGSGPAVPGRSREGAERRDRLLHAAVRDAARDPRPAAATYCGSIGVEYMHIQDPEQKQWLQDRMEAHHELCGSWMTPCGAAS